MNLSVAVQAGGESRRMGHDKALAMMHGEPLVQRVCRRLGGLGDDLFVTTNEPGRLAFLGVPCHPDLEPGRGALGGLQTALAHARHPLVAVVACDMPFASPELIRLACARIGECDAAVFRGPRGWEPLHAIYRRDTCLPAVHEALDKGLWRMDSWFPQVQIRFLDPEEWTALDPEGSAFVNVNTPEDLAAAETTPPRSGNVEAR